MAENQKPTINVNIPDHLKTGVAANLVSVTITGNQEVILDFVFAHPLDRNNNMQMGTVVSRVILPLKVVKDLNLIFQSQLGKSKPE